MVFDLSPHAWTLVLLIPMVLMFYFRLLFWKGG